MLIYIPIGGILNNKYDMEAIKSIKNRYSDESKNSCNLSCGSNIDLLAIKNGEFLLDIGCGRGNESIEAALKAGPEGKVTGLDVTREMIEKARENALNSGVSNIDFVEGEIECLPFDKNTFNAVMSNCVINHALSKKKAFKEIFRVLRKGGRFVISDAVTMSPLPPSIRNDPEARAQCFGGAVTEKEYLDSIKLSGFKDARIVSKRKYVKNGYDFASITLIAYKK